MAEVENLADLWMDNTDEYDLGATLSPQFTRPPPQVMLNGSSGVMDESISQMFNKGPSPTYGRVANNKDSDVQALDKLSKTITEEDGLVAVENQNLELDPQLIPGQFIVSGSIDLLHKDSWDVPASAGGGSCWKKHGRELGWAVGSLFDVSMPTGYKRTFVFHRNGTKTDWIMNVYALVEKGTFRLNTTKFLCQVFQNNMYDPRPLLPSPVTTELLEENISAGMHDPRNFHGLPEDTVADANNKYGLGFSSSSSSSFPFHSSSSFQGNFKAPAQPLIRALFGRTALDPASMHDPRNFHGSPMDTVADANNKYGWGLSSSSSSSFPSHPSSSFQGDFMAPAQPLNPALSFGRTALDPAHKTSTGDENCNPDAAGSSSSTGMASGKKRKSSVHSKFTEIYASNPEGKVLTLLICNRCGMVYNKTSGTGTIGKHKCNNH